MTGDLRVVLPDQLVAAHLNRQADDRLSAAMTHSGRIVWNPQDRLVEASFSSRRERRHGMSIKKIVRTLRPLQQIRLRIAGHDHLAEDPLTPRSHVNP